MRIYIIILAIFMASTLAKHLVGYSNENQKIVNGEDAEQGQFPYQVKLIHRSYSSVANALKQHFYI